MRIIRQSATASVAHRYWNDQWDVEKNAQIYGADASSQGIGSNLLLEVEAEGEDDAGVSPALQAVKALVDHQSLFTPTPSTLERLAAWLGRELFAHPLKNARWRGLTVWERDDLGCLARPDGTLELRFRILNLMLGLSGPVDTESGLMLRRRDVENAVRHVFLSFGEKSISDRHAWGVALYAQMQRSLPMLTYLHIDLGRHEYLIFPEPV